MEPKPKRGFAALTADERREIASMGGRAAHASGNAHEWNTEAAREAGKKGGKAAQGKRKREPGAV